MKEQKVIYKMLFNEFEDFADGSASQPLYSDNDLKQAETSGYNQGFEQGYTEGLKQGIEKITSENNMQMKQLTETLTQKIKTLVEQDTLRAHQSTEKMIFLIRSIVKKILPNLVKTHGISEIESTIRHIFSGFLEKQALLIRLNPEIMPIVSKDLNDITVQFDKFLNFEQDSKLGFHDCEIEWHGGGALWSQTCTLQKIEEMLLTSLNTITNSEELIETEKEASDVTIEEKNEETNSEINQEVSEEINEVTNE